MDIQSNYIGPFPAAQTTDPYGSLKNFDTFKYLGKGHFSTVYSARNRFTNCRVALKKVEVNKRRKSFPLPFCFFFFKDLSNDRCQSD